MLDMRRAIPLHRQFKELLYEQVVNGHFPYGTKIPSEREFCMMYKISRITVRQALSEAVQEGWLFRQAGRGTFAGQIRRVEHGLSKIVRFCSSMQSAGLYPMTQVIDDCTLPADITLLRIFNLTEPAEVVNLKLLGFGTDEPMVVYDAYFEPVLGVEMVRRARERSGKDGFSTLDLYDELAPRAPFKTEQTFEATNAPAWVAQYLRISEEKPVFMITSIFYDGANRPVEYRRAFYRGDRYRFYLTRKCEE